MKELKREQTSKIVGGTASPARCARMEARYINGGGGERLLNRIIKNCA